jgi:hypothetical protein
MTMGVPTATPPAAAEAKEEGKQEKQEEEEEEEEGDQEDEDDAICQAAPEEYKCPLTLSLFQHPKWTSKQCGSGLLQTLDV